MLFDRRVVNCTAEKPKIPSAVFVKVLERQYKLLMSRRFGGMKLQLDWVLDEL
jgi:hypothetical protein